LEAESGNQRSWHDECLNRLASQMSGGCRPVELAKLTQEKSGSRGKKRTVGGKTLLATGKKRTANTIIRSQTDSLLRGGRNVTDREGKWEIGEK